LCQTGVGIRFHFVAAVRVLFAFFAKKKKKKGKISAAFSSRFYK
jgi:hypothetical protein